MSDNRTVCEIYQEYQDECKHCLRAEVATLRHDLLNEQAASRMAHEVAARNRALEAENAQLRHALANAEVAAGFAKEMAEKVKCYRNALERIAEVGCPRCPPRA